MKINKLSVAMMMAMSGVNAYAENATALPTVSISASPIHQHDVFEVPSQVDIVDQQTLMQNSTSALGKQLEQIPGVNNQSTGSQSGKPVIRGMTGNRIKVLSNGQATDYQAYGTRHNPNIDPYLADRIEVIRGPQSVLYGSDAMGGVVNVIQPELPYGQKLQGELAGEYQSNNQENMLGAKVGAGSDKFAVNAGVSVREADNFRVPDVSSSEGATPAGSKSDKPLFVGEVPFTNFENRAANIGLGYQDDWGNVELRYTDWQSKQNFLGIEADSPTSPYEAVAAGQELNNDEIQLTSEIFAGDWVIKPSWSHTRNQREATHDEPYEHMAAEKGTDHYLDILVKRDDYKLALEHPKIGDFEGEIGFEITEKQQELRSGHLTPSADVSKRAVYLFEEADYDKWLVQFGARYDSHSVNAPVNEANEHFEHLGFFDESNNSADFGVASGSLGATYRFDSQWSLAANLATGFRAPTIFELYAGGEHGGVQAFQLGNPDLEAETSINTDLSLRYQDSRTQMVATLYQNTIDNYIHVANTGYYRYSEAAIEANPGLDEDDLATRFTDSAPGRLPEMQAQQTDARIHGVELSLNHRINARWSADFGLELIRGEDTENDRILPLMPANNARVAVNYQPQDAWGLKQQQWRLAMKWVDAKDSAGAYEPFSQFDDKVKVGTASTDAYTVWDLGYQGQVKWNNQTLKLAATVENLFDTDYVDFLNTYKGYTLNQGRNFKLSARMDF